MFKFNFIMNDDDYFKFTMYHMKTAASMKSLFTTFRRQGLVCVILSVAIFALTDGFTIFATALALAALMLLTVSTIGRNIFLKHLAKKQIKGMKKDGKLPYGKNVSMVFDEEGILSASELNETKVGYEAIERICEAEGDDAIYIFISSLQGFIIPHRIFESEAQRAEFMTFIQGKAQNK